WDGGHAPGRRCPGDGGRFGVDPGPNDLRLTPDPGESGGDGRDVAAAQDETFELDRIRDLFEHQGVGEPATGYGSADEDTGRRLRDRGGGARLRNGGLDDGQFVAGGAGEHGSKQLIAIRTVGVDEPGAALGQI